MPTANRETYRQFAEDAAAMFKRHGALRLVECWGEDVPEGVLTSFPKAVGKKDDETVVFSWIVWPSKVVRDEGWKQAMQEPSMQPGAVTMPFDGKRMIYGGFEPFLGDVVGEKTGIQPYLFFRGRCEEAIGYYKEKLGSEVLMMMRFKDNPDQACPDMPPALNDKIMHACLRIQGTEIMMSDGMKTGPLDFQCMSLSLAVPKEAEADRVFHALTADGNIEMPIGKTFFSPRFGALIDKFGVSWMITVPQPGV